MDDMEHLSKPSEDVSEVIFSQPEERAGATGPHGSVLDRRNEDGWLDDTEPYHGARPRTTEVDRSVDDVLSATISGTEQDLNFRDTLIPKLPPEQRIRQEEEVQTPPRKGATQGRGSATEGTSGYDKWNSVSPWGPYRTTNRNCWSKPANRRVVTCGGIGEYSVTYTARSGGPADREPVSEDAEATGVRVPPDTPLRDIVDRCRVWESHADPEVRRVSKPMPEPAYPTYVVKQSEYDTEPMRVVTVNKPNSPVDQSEELLNKLLAVLTPAVSPPAKAPELSPMDKLVQLFLLETAKSNPVPPAPAEPPGLETLLRTYFAEQQPPRQELRFRPVRRNWSDVKCFSCGKTGHSATRCPTLDVSFPFILPGWKAEKTSSGYLMISPKMATDRRQAENED